MSYSTYNLHSENVMSKVMTHRNGFQITLPGGYRVSFAFGQGSYADNRYAGMGTTPAPSQWESNNFELAVFDPEGEMMDLVTHKMSDGTTVTDNVVGYVPAYYLRTVLLRVAMWDSSKSGREENKRRALVLGDACERARKECDKLETDVVSPCE